MSLFSAFGTGIRAASGLGSGGSVSGGGSSLEWGERQFGGWSVGSAAGMRVSPGRARQLSTVFACVAKKSTAIAMLPFKIYQDDGKGGSKVVRNHPLYDILYSQPNHLQTAFEFKQLMQSHVELRGNAFAEIIPGDRGPVDELMPMHPDLVRVEQLQGSGRLRYRYRDPLTNTERVLMQDEVFHLRDQPDVVGVGISRIAQTAEVLGLGLLMQDYRARFMANDATPGALITGANFAKVEDEDAFVESLQKSRTKENRGRPFMLPPGIDMKTLSVSPVDQQLMDGLKLSDQQICSIFNVLPHTIGVDAGKAATFASTEQFNLMHVQQCVLPMAIMWEQAIQRCLITSPIYYAKASLASLMRGDAGTRGKFYQLLWSCGAICDDEIRELEDMNPIADGSGKRFWTPLNYGLANRTPALTPSASGGSNGSDSDDDDEAGDQEGSGGDDGESNDGAEDSDSEQAAGMSPQIIAQREQKKLDGVVKRAITALVEHQRFRANRKAA